MKRLSRPRRSLWLVLGLVIGVLATAATMAVAGLQPADLNFTPRTEAQTTNVDVARAWAKNYYGAHTAVSGPNGTWYTPLNLESNYANEARSVADHTDHWLAARRHVPHRAIVLDVDDTTLTTWNYELYSNWDFNPTTNAQFVGITNGAFTGNMFPPTPGMLDLANHASPGLQHLLDHRARRFAHAATIANLVDDSAAGLPPSTKSRSTGTRFRRSTRAIRCPHRSTSATAGSPTASSRSRRSASTQPISTRPSSVGRSSTQGVSCPTIQYKSGTRAYIESQGYDIVADIGDQFSDLEGNYADKVFKMPNPNYYLP